MCLDSPSDPEKQWVHDPIVLGNDQPCFKGHGGFQVQASLAVRKAAVYARPSFQ